MYRNHKNKAQAFFNSRFGGNIDKNKLKLVKAVGNVFIFEYCGAVWAIEEDILKNVN